MNVVCFFCFGSLISMMAIISISCFMLNIFLILTYYS
ncbi:unnamed protein product [Amoebophrya sp. A25]|nr:unnamed protein product [Amoebophrya sp. A25]|eukprot:GSA25T00027270001.1